MLDRVPSGQGRRSDLARSDWRLTEKNQAFLRRLVFFLRLQYAAGLFETALHVQVCSL